MKEQQQIKASRDLLETILEIAQEGVEQLERQAASIPKDDYIESRNRRLFAMSRLNTAKRAVHELEKKIVFG
tara:strand:- start:455 stop:670 length:216 start_codon:yes stop_codon:yes gene_type:complete